MGWGVYGGGLRPGGGSSSGTAMGKGKAKGFRPPKDDKSMLFGSADHLTGNTIASPVQLRAEGIPLPKDHMNFGDEWGKGDGKGDGKGSGPVTACTFDESWCQGTGQGHTSRAR